MVVAATSLRSPERMNDITRAFRTRCDVCRPAAVNVTRGKDWSCDLFFNERDLIAKLSAANSEETSLANLSPNDVFTPTTAVQLYILEIPSSSFVDDETTVPVLDSFVLGAQTIIHLHRQGQPDSKQQQSRLATPTCPSSFFVPVSRLSCFIPAPTLL